MNTLFAHQRLHAYQVALNLFAGVEQIASAFPQGYADLRDQLRRSAAATVRHIAEGANRFHSADKAARFIVARGECGECDACLEMVGILDLVPAARLGELRRRADRVGAMLTGLIQKEQRPR